MWEGLRISMLAADWDSSCECPPFPDEQLAEDEISYAKMLEEIKPDAE
jgi:hypothetical protein